MKKRLGLAHLKNTNNQRDQKKEKMVAKFLQNLNKT